MITCAMPEIGVACTNQQFLKFYSGSERKEATVTKRTQKESESILELHDVSGGERRELDGVPAGQGGTGGRRWRRKDVAVSALQDGRVL